MSTNPEPPSPRDRLRRMSRWMQALVAFGAVILLLVPVWVMQSDPQDLDDSMRRVLGAAGRLAAAPLPLPGLAALATLPAVALGLYALGQMWQLFAAYGRGAVFGPQATGRLRRLGWALVASSLLQPLTHTVMVLLLTLGNPAGQRRLSVGVGWNDYLALLFGGLLLAIAWAMAEGARIERENESFV